VVFCEGQEIKIPNARLNRILIHVSSPLAARE
jgi:hypothetical protein